MPVSPIAGGTLLCHYCYDPPGDTAPLLTARDDLLESPEGDGEEEEEAPSQAGVHVSLCVSVSVSERCTIATLTVESSLGLDYGNQANCYRAGE